MRRSILIILCLALLWGCAMQQDVVILDERLAALERRNISLEKQSLDLQQQSLALDKKLDKKIEQLASRVEQLASRLDEEVKGLQEKEVDLRAQSADKRVMLDKFREEIQALRGRLEETEYFLKQKKSSSEDSGKKIEARLDKLDKLDELTRLNKQRIAIVEQYLNLESSEKTGSVPKTGAEIAKEPSDSDLYATSKQAFDQGDAETAREGFQRLLQKYPKSERADNAQFWIGEIYYREKWYEKAILEYQKVIEKYPSGNKVPASYLKQGLSFLNLGDKTNARLVLMELVNKYPKSNEAEIASKKLKELK